jgi:vacuolar protein sorting-associated protein 26
MSKPTLDIIVDEVPGRRKLALREKNSEMTKLPVFNDRESISGKIIINLNKIKKYEHQGIKVELFGMIENLQDKKSVSRFISLAKDMDPPGTLTTEITTLPFTFTNVEKQYETYRGANMQVRYIVKVTIAGKMLNVTAEQEFAVINPQPESILLKDNEPIKLEVGIEDWLHLVFELDRSKFHLKDCLVGNVTFKKVSIRLKSMEIQLIKREIITSNYFIDNDVITKFEIMDGAPIKSKIIIKIQMKLFQLDFSFLHMNLHPHTRQLTIDFQPHISSI